MKTKLLSAVVLALGCIQVVAQESYDYEIKLSNPGQKCSLFLRSYYSADIEIEGHGGDAMLLTFGDPSKGKLTKEDFLFDMFEENNRVSIIKRSSRPDRVRIIIKVPMNCQVSLDTYFARNIRISNIRADVKIDTQTGNIKSENVVGNVEADTFGGTIEVSDLIGAAILNNTQGEILCNFKLVSQTVPSAFTNIHGDIDLQIPMDSKATFDLSNLKGDINTNLNLSLVNRANLSGVTSRGILRQLNGGGVWISIKNLHGNITINNN